MDVASLAGNIASGNVGGALLDAAGLIYDSVATVVPVLPGGAGALIKAGRVADRLAESRKAGNALRDAVAAEKRGQGLEVATELPVRSAESGRLRYVDVATKDKSAGVGLNETKKGATNGRNARQREVDAEIERSGGTIVGKGKPGFPPGERIPPTKTCVINPDRPNCP
jgi:hypothetical protein